MAATVTVTEAVHGSVKKVQWTWISSTGGDVADGAGITTAHYYNGKVEALVNDPSTAAPSTGFAFTVTDDDGYDVLAGAGATPSTSLTQTTLSASLGIVAYSKLTLGVTGAGSGKGGVTTVYIR